ncbi:MAG: FtsW/RodA/SpoVE family cell cycle protein [Bacteroidales bacterium]|nr:FtsW/RodA/SpoVE family cell cycle protein [Bacteroidales bacterium]
MSKGKNGTIWDLAGRLKGDKVVWIIVMMLILISIVCMFSSTSRLLHDGMTRLDLVRNQMVVVGIGLALILICYNIRSKKFFRVCSMLGFPVSFLLLLLLDIHVNLPFVKALNINEAYRVLSVAGFQIHVFELVKVAMVLYLAWALDSIEKGILKAPKNKLWRKIIYIYAPFIIVFLMIIPGSNSSALFIGMIMFIVILLGGDSLRDMTLLALFGVALVAGCVGIYKISNGQYMKRIGTGIERITERDDWETQFLQSPKGTDKYQKALDEMRQPYSAKIAIKEGGLLGKGPGQSTQRYVVPDISEDYVYSFIIEEYGLIGGILVIFLYVSLLARASIIVRNCKQTYAKLAVAGLSLLISGQAFLHMFVNADIGPMTGQTLPLISHGNSAFICFSLAFGVILSISRIAADDIAKETRNAEPLFEKHERIKDDLDTLDSLESEDFKNTDIYGEL